MRTLLPSARYHSIASAVILLTAILALPGPAHAEDLCPKSVAWFACTLDNGKSVAICGTPSVDQDRPVFGADNDSSLQYRFGRPGKIELEYPQGTGFELWRNFLGGVEFMPGGTAQRVNFSFITDNTRYLIQGNRQDGRVNYTLSVLSEDPVKTLAEFQCAEVQADNLLPIALAVPCDPNDLGNETRGEVCP
jgi:hypothetical protein